MGVGEGVGGGVGWERGGWEKEEGVGWERGGVEGGKERSGREEWREGRGRIVMHAVSDWRAYRALHVCILQRGFEKQEG